MTSTMIRTALGLMIAFGGVSATAAPARPFAVVSTPGDVLVTQAAEDELAQAFPNAHNVQWKSAEEEGVYTAYFSVGSVKTTANIDKDGALLSVFRYFDANSMPDR